MTSTEDPKQRYEALLFNSPSRWETVRVGDAGHVQLGRQKSPGNRSDKFPTPYVRAGNITWNGLQLENALEMEFTPDERETFQLHPGDVLLSEASGSASEVGKPAIWPEGMGLFCFQNTVVRFRSKLLVPRYSLLLFTAYAQRGIFAAQSRGVGIHHLSARRFAELLIPIPPQAEQDRIADRVEELFTDLDAGVAALQRVQKKLKRYRAALLHAAVTGRLTADWRAKHGDGGETGSQLLERILVARREAWEERTLAEYEEKGRQPPSAWELRYPEPTMPDNEHVCELPIAWTHSSLEQLCFVSSGTTPKRGNDRFWKNGEVPWVTSTVVNDEFVDAPSELVTVEALHETSLQVYPIGTLLIALYGEGKTRGKVSELRIESTINQAMAALTWFEKSETSKSFVKCVLAEMYQRLRREAAGGVQPNLNAGLVKRVSVPLPPLAEQFVIADVVQERMSQIDAMEAEVERGLRRSGRLRQAILKAAFEGKLVPQNPDDEPASELLARIQAEAEAEVAAAPKRTPRKRKTTKKKPSKKETA
jgi:type I restriction enzyme S subunit